ncbi:MAG: hypothetical protein KF746_15760 [Chitinophagaceae bacterium]|nr:hypothetical protein [Chitinophagaceae bacterium]
MKKIILSVLLSAALIACNNKEPFDPPYDGAVGYVIGKENCNMDENKDFWLINIISSSSVRQQYGDTLVLDGVEYTNVVKSTGLEESLKTIGEKVGIDFTITDTPSSTTNCNVTNPVTYKLKIAAILRSGPAVF